MIMAAGRFCRRQSGAAYRETRSVANAFQEQFLKLGLVDEKKVSKTQHEQHKQLK